MNHCLKGKNIYNYKVEYYCNDRPCLDCGIKFHLRLDAALLMDKTCLSS